MNFSRSFKLDILRIVFCVCVLICHFYPGCHALAGQVGVLGFFVLSGYLLQMSFFRMSRGMDIEKFYASKARRLIPAYVCSLLVALLVPAYCVITGVREFLPPLEQYRFSFFRCVSYYNIPAWYMGCLFVYIIMAPFLWWLHRMRWGIPALFCIALAFSSFLYWRYNGTAMVRMGANLLSIGPQVRLWQFLAGMVIARVACCSGCGCIFSSHTLRRVCSWPTVIFLILTSIWISIHYDRGCDFPNCYWFDICVVLALAFLTALWNDGRNLPYPVAEKMLIWVGSLTYGVYLFHLPVYHILEPIWSRLPAVMDPYIISVAVLVSVLMTDLLNRSCACLWKKK